MLIEGDGVVLKDGRLGLLVDVRPGAAARPFGVRFVNNGPVRRFGRAALRRATYDEWQSSHMHGVGARLDR
jgi:hypothetical protein